MRRGTGMDRAGLSGPDPGTGHVSSALGDPDARVRGEAFAALVSNRNNIAHVLEGCLSSPDPGVRACAIMVLANRGDAGSATRIMELAGDPDPGVRECVAGAAGRLGGAEAHDTIGRLLRDAHKGVREGAARAAEELGAGP